MVTDTQVRKLMQELQKHGQMNKAAQAAGMSRTTAYRYVDAGKLPSGMKPERTWSNGIRLHPAGRVLQMAFVASG